MKIAFIVNPKSGKAGKNNEILKIVREFTRGRGLDANIFVTKHKGVVATRRERHEIPLRNIGQLTFCDMESGKK